MTMYEILSLIASGFALLFSGISLNQIRKFNKKLINLQSASSELAEKQLANLEEEESLTNQPTFAIQTIGVSGIGDIDSPEYRVNIKYKLIHSGNSYLSLQHILPIALRGGLVKSAIIAGVYQEFGEAVIGEHTISIKPDSELFDCKIHIIYTDVEGTERIQEFGIFPEGPPGPIPMRMRFEREKIYKVKPNTSALWIKPTK